MYTEYEAFYTGPDGLRWRVCSDGRNEILALDEQCRSGVAMGILFDSEEEAREFCAKRWPEVAMPLTVQPDSIGFVSA